MKKNEAQTILKQAGCKVTQERLLVLAVLASSKHPISVQEILRSGNSIDQATVYRILNLFKAKGIVNQIDLQDTKAYFELKDTAGDHHHIVCVKCKKVKDFTGCNYETLIHSVLNKSHGFAKVINHSFELFGLCNSCAT